MCDSEDAEQGETDLVPAASAGPADHPDPVNVDETPEPETERPASPVEKVTTPTSPTVAEATVVVEATPSVEPTADVTDLIIILPWGAQAERLTPNMAIPIDLNLQPGEYLLHTLFAEFTLQVDKRVELIMAEPLERPLTKSLQRGEDIQFDQLLIAFNSVAEHCLPSILTCLYSWYEKQHSDEAISLGLKQHSPAGRNKGEAKDKDFLLERRDLAVDFVFCLVLLEVLKQLPVHPVPEDLLTFVEDQAFRHFKPKDDHLGPNAVNINTISDLYAEVVGEVAKTRFQSIRRRFMNELKELRGRDLGPQTTQAIVSLIMGMKFFRVKMFPVEEFEACFQFMQEWAQYFLEVKEKEIKHALAGLLVEILLPVAAQVKNEVNVPCLKNFVDTLYQTTLDWSNKNKHRLALFPLVTCLLCVSQKQFFLNNWHIFLSACISHLKNRDIKMSRVALESLYRLLWVYMVRIKCESNTVTQNRLQNIVNNLFPKNSRNLVPKDTPLNIFVKIIHFIAQEKLDFAMKDVIYDLLSVSKTAKFMINPERMNVGLRAFLVIADSLQQKDNSPAMPTTSGNLPSGGPQRVKKTFLTKTLTDIVGKDIGIAQYFTSIRRAMDSIIRSLDLQVGRTMLMTSAQNVNKEPEEITGERKAKLDLFRTCVAAIPRIIPEGLSRTELLEMLSRLTVHLDEELRGLAFTALQNLMVDMVDWRADILQCFINFIVKDIADNYPSILDSSLRMLNTILTHWKTAPPLTLDDKDRYMESPNRCLPFDTSPHAPILHLVEGFALTMLSSLRPMTRKLTVNILKEVRHLFTTQGMSKGDDMCAIDVIDSAMSELVEQCMPYLPAAEKIVIASTPNIDIQWLSDRTSMAWASSNYDTQNLDSPQKDHHGSSSYSCMDSFEPWTFCLAGCFRRQFLISKCPQAVGHAWSFANNRITMLFTHIDPSNPPAEVTNRGSLKSTKKLVIVSDVYMKLWRNYLVVACCSVPSSYPPIRCVSPEMLSSSTESGSSSTVDPNKSSSGSSLFKLLIPLLRCDNVEIREAVVAGLGHVCSHAFRELFEEIYPAIKEAVDRKQENMRRRKKRNEMRLHLVRMFELMGENSCVTDCLMFQSKDGYYTSLRSKYVELIDGIRLYLENEGDKDQMLLPSMKRHFCACIRKVIQHLPLDKRADFLPRDLKKNLFMLLSNYCSYHTTGFQPSHSQTFKFSDQDLELELESLQAMSALSCCGPVFDSQALMPMDGYLYQWLDSILDSEYDLVQRLGEETVTMLLINNPDNQALIDWVIDRCYTGSQTMSCRSFLALATVVNDRQPPCDMIALLNVTLYQTGHAETTIRDAALRLLQVLDRRFFVAPEDFGDPDAVVGAHVQLPPTHCKSQMYLSEELAKNHPELTIPVYSEISQRCQTALYPARANMLSYLLPWMYNIELVTIPVPSTVEQRSPDPPTVPQPSRSVDTITSGECWMRGPLVGEGWGSKPATDLVLNNLFYITVMYGDDHPKQIEKLWAGLCSCFANNLRIILNYLIEISAVQSNPDLLPYAKRVILYLAKMKPGRLMDELTVELRHVDMINSLVERTDEPPYYCLVHTRKTATSAASTNSATTVIDGVSKTGHVTSQVTTGSDPSISSMKDDLTLSISTTSSSSMSQHSSDTSKSSTQRLSTDESQTLSVTSVGTVRSSSSTSSSQTLGGDGLQEHVSNHEPENDDGGESPLNIFASWQAKVNGSGGQPHPLPMPHDHNGYYAPIYDFMSDNVTPHMGMFRCNVAVVFITDLVVSDVDVDWTVHLPLLLHVLFLGFDHSRPLVHEQCKHLLLHLTVVLSAHGDHYSVARLLLSHARINEACSLTPPLKPSREYNFTGDGCARVREVSADSESSDTSGISSPSDVSAHSVGVHYSPVDSVTVEVQSLNTVPESAIALIEFITSRKCKPLWCNEDITPRSQNIISAEQIELFVKHILKIFTDSLPSCHLEQRWAQVALQMALSCSSRHYAGRSFQIFRALHVPLTSRTLSDILTRLLECVADSGEDLQGYVTEIIMTLEQAVDCITSNSSKIVNIVSGSNTLPSLGYRRSAGPVLQAQIGEVRGIHGRAQSAYQQHSTDGRTVFTDKQDSDKHGRPHSSSDVDRRSKSHTFSRAQSAYALRYLAEEHMVDDKLNIQCQIFWITVALLESDYEYEFLLAMRLFDKTLSSIDLESPDVQHHLTHLLDQMHWLDFPGVQSLLLKGLTSPTAAETCLQLLSQLTCYHNLPIIDPVSNRAFPINIIAILPHLVAHFDEPDTFCRRYADNVTELCQGKSVVLDNLGTVMNVYSRQTYSKDCVSWINAICKYLCEAYSPMTLTLITFLIELLEKGPQTMQVHVVYIINSLLNNIDINTVPRNVINGNTLRVLARFLQSGVWKESLKTVKSVVTRSSSLVSPPQSLIESRQNSLSPCSDSFVKLELPGRTMEFAFDMKLAPIVGQKLPSPSQPPLPPGASQEELAPPIDPLLDTGEDVVGGDGDQNKGGASTPIVLTTMITSNPVQTSANTTPWKKPHMSQRRTRERLIGVLNCFGGNVGLPRSPSVVFSSSSDIAAERQMSIYSSSEETSMAEGQGRDLDDNSSIDQQFGVFKDFDFLDIELEEGQDDVMDSFNWGVRRQSIDGRPESTSSQGRHRRVSGSAPNLVRGIAEDEDSSDDESDSDSATGGEDGVLLGSSPNEPRSTNLSNIRKSSSSPMSMSSRSQGSEQGDGGEGGTPLSSPHHSLMTPYLLSIPDDDMEDMWRSHVDDVMADNSASHALNTYQLFNKLFRTIKSRCYHMTRESCEYLPEHFYTISTLFSSMLEVLMTQAVCPYVYVDLDAMVTARLVERQKFCVLEIQEHFDSYVIRRDNTVDSLDNLKSSVKLQSQNRLWDQQMELCRSLYKLHFQLLLLFQSYCKLLECLSIAHRTYQVNDHSKEVSNLISDVQRAINEIESSAAEQVPDDPIPEPWTVSIETLEQSIRECFTCKNFTKAVRIVRKHRNVWPGGSSSNSSHDDVCLLLSIYCKHLSDRRAGVIVVTIPPHDLSEICNQLMNSNVQLLGSLRSLEEPVSTVHNDTGDIETETETISYL